MVGKELQSRDILMEKHTIYTHALNSRGNSSDTAHFINPVWQEILVTVHDV